MEKIVEYFGSAFLAMTALPVLKLLYPACSQEALFIILLSTICQRYADNEETVMEKYWMSMADFCWICWQWDF